MKKSKRKDREKWMRCVDCKRVKWCLWPVWDGPKKNVGVCPKCWKRGS